LKPLLESGVVAEERAGAGRRFAVRDATALRTFRERQFPDAVVADNSPARVAAVARFRDTKALPADTAEIVCLRVWWEGAIFKHGAPVDATGATIAHGVFAFLLTPDSPYELHGTCALVENPAVFAAVEQLHLDLGAVVYGRGRISNLLLSWLAGAGNSDLRLVHFPDYDPAGLSEFQRLRLRLGERIALHLPVDLETRFARFSNRGLLEKGNSQKMLAQLRRSNLPGILRVVELIDRHNAGLEQEALLLQC
jgi:hypothetical protein